MIITVTPQQFLDMEPNKRLMIVKEHIELNPENHDQNSFCDIRGEGYNSTGSVEEVKDTADCGTTLCVCGWTHLLAGSCEWNGETEAAKWLGLDYSETQKMFYYLSDEDTLMYMDKVIQDHS